MIFETNKLQWTRKAIHDLCEAVKQLDDQHQQNAFYACLAEIAREFNW